MKSIRNIVVVLFLLVTVAAISTLFISESADSDVDYSGQCGDNLKWTYDSSSMTLSIFKMNYSLEDATMYDYDSSSRLNPWIGLVIKDVVITDATSIGNYAFYNCDFLDTTEYYIVFNIPDSVTSIGSYAFYKCRSLEEVVVGANVLTIGKMAFQECYDLKSIEVDTDNHYYYSIDGALCSRQGTLIKLAESTTYYTHDFRYKSIVSIADYALSNQKNLTHCKLPNSLKNIGDYAFYNSNQLKEIDIPSSVTHIGRYAFNLCFDKDVTSTATIRSSSIDDYAFYDSGLSYVVLENVKKIGKSAFAECQKLKYVTMPNTLETIEEYAFSYCSELTMKDYTTSKYITARSIKDYAFNGCIELKEVCLSERVEDIGCLAFRGCEILNEFVVETGNSSYHVTNGVLFNNDQTILVKYPTGKLGTSPLAEYSIPYGVKEISPYAFSESKLVTVTVGTESNDGKDVSYLITINHHAFSDCSQLEHLVIEKHGGNVYETMPLINIFEGAFSSCTQLKDVYFGKNDQDLIDKFDNLKSIGDYVFSDCTSMTSFYFSSKVETIGMSAFYRCTTLVTVKLPTSLTSIGASAFYGCTKLNGIFTDVDLSNLSTMGRYAFSDCTSLTSVIIPSNVKYITDYAFSGCIALTSVSFTGNVERLGNYAFSNCTVLKNNDSGTGSEFTLPDSVTSIGNNAFRGSFQHSSAAKTIVAKGVVTIGDYAFCNCYNIETVTLNDPSNTSANRKSIGNYAFQGCGAMESFDYQGVDSIGDYAFDSCVSLTKATQYALVIPDSVKHLGSYSFHKCNSIVNLTLNDTDMSSYVFAECAKLEHVFITTGPAILGDYAFDNCQKLTDIDLGSVVVGIGDGAFHRCTSLNMMIGGDVVKKVGNYSFSECIAITKVTLRSLTSLEIIQSYAFNKSGLDSFTSDTVKSIGSFAFYGCKSLTNVRLDSIVESIGDNVFMECPIMESLYLDPANERYRTDQSALVDTESKTLLYYPPCAPFVTYDLHDDIKIISNGAFNGNPNLTNLSLGKGLEEIGDRAFENCNGLKSVTMMNGVSLIGTLAFGDCTQIEKISISSALLILGLDAFRGITFYDTDGVHMIVQDTTSLRGATFEKSADKLIMVSKAGYCIRLDANGGVCDTIAVGTDPDGRVSDLPDASFEDKVFIGWYTMPNGGNKIEDGHQFIYNTTIYAQYKSFLKHHVIYDSNGGSGAVPEQDDVQEGLAFTVKTYTGSKSGFVFSGWSYMDTIYRPGDRITMGTVNIKMVAVWRSSSYHHVTYDVNGGSSTPPYQDDVREGAYFYVAGYDGTMKGFTFGGWISSGITYQPGEMVTMGSTNYNFVALWNPKPAHKIIYNLDGGSGIAPIQADVREDAEFIVKGYEGTKSGVHFSGWVYKHQVFQPGESATMGDSDMELMAFWTSGIIHHVTYELNGGKGEVPIQEDVIEGMAFIVAPCDATRSGYVFSGWSYDDDTYLPGDTIVVIHSDIILKAVWNNVILHHVAYEVDGGSSTAPIQSDVSEGSSFTVKGYTGIKQGYNFEGWTFNEKAYVEGDVIIMGEEDITLTAIWVPMKSDESIDNTFVLAISLMVLLSLIGIICAIHIVKTRE